MRVFDSIESEIVAYKTALIKAKMDNYYRIINPGAQLTPWQDEDYKRFSEFVDYRIQKLKQDPNEFHKLAYETLNYSS